MSTTLYWNSSLFKRTIEREKKGKKYLLKRPGRSSLLILIKLVKLVHKMVRKDRWKKAINNN